MPNSHNAWQKWRQNVGAWAFHSGLEALARGGRAHPRAIWQFREVSRRSNLAYGPRGRANLLDVYEPRQSGPVPDHPASSPAGRPCVLYLHGGAFRILSKDTHWMMGLQFARQGYVVFNANYRLAPKNPYPAAIEDASAALLWVFEHAREFGADPTKLVVAGESAGANLAVALGVVASYPRPEPFARSVFDAGFAPRAVVAACGMLQVSQSSRFAAHPRLSPWLADRVREVEHGYLSKIEPHVEADLVDRLNATADDASLADPLTIIERAAPARHLPPTFALVGTRDPLLDDSRRLKRAYAQHGDACELRIDAGGLHAYHAVYWTPRSRAAWAHQEAFLRRALGVRPT